MKPKGRNQPRPEPTFTPSLGLWTNTCLPIVVAFLNQLMAHHGQDLGGAPGPLGFDREEERLVAMAALPSLFCVLVNPKDIDNQVLKNRYKNLANTVLKDDKRRCRGIKNLDDAITAKTRERQATGFVVAAHNTTLRVLTCAHIIADIFTVGHHNHFSLEEVNDMFRFDVHCYHHEINVRTRNIIQKISERRRFPTQTRVIALDTQKDLLVIEFDIGYLCERDETDVGGARTWCQADHPVIHRADADPNKMQKMVLAGWPPQRAGSCAMGQVSFCHWTYDAITAVNFKGYTMRLLEIPGMVADNGFSGAPVLNGAGQYVGVFHGVFNLSTGYAICSEDVRDFLQQHNVVRLCDNNTYLLY